MHACLAVRHVLLLTGWQTCTVQLCTNSLQACAFAAMLAGTILEAPVWCLVQWPQVWVVTGMTVVAVLLGPLAK